MTIKNETEGMPLMQYYFVEPDVSISLGDRTVMDTSMHPPVVSDLHIIVLGWFDNHLLETFPSFVFSEKLSTAIQADKLTGVSFSNLEMTKGDFFDEGFPGVVLPKLVWGKITGKEMQDDFFIAKDLRLVVSNNALAKLKEHGIDRAEIEVFK